MGRRTPTLFLVSILLLLNGAHADLSDFVRFENDAGDILKPKQPILAERDGRFIRFDTSDTEIELELGVSVPFLKIPLHASTALEHTTDHRLTINPAGLLIGATIFFTSFLLVPWVLPKGGHHTRKDDHTLGDGGRSESGGPYGMFVELEKLLKANKLDPYTCPQKILCIVGQQIASTVPGLFESILQLDAVKKFNVMNVIATGSCNDRYKDCMLNRKSLKAISRLSG